jgi:hypothetical protein
MMAAPRRVPPAPPPPPRLPPRLPTALEEIDCFLLGIRERGSLELQAEIDRWRKQLEKRKSQ